MFKKIILMAMIVMMVPVLALAQGKYSIKSMTPEVKQALESRKERFSQLRALKSSGTVGENNHGYVEVFGNNADAQSIVAAENHDRTVLYETIAQQNGLEGAISTIETAFADVQKEKAEAGDKIQMPDGSWTSK